MATIARASKVDLLHFLVDTQRLLNAGSFDAERVMAMVLQRAHTATGAQGASVELVDGDAMVLRASTGSLEQPTGRQVGSDGSPSARCVRMGMPLICRDTGTDLRVDKEACRRMGARSMVVAPIVSGGQGIGALTLVSDRADHFTDSDSDLVELMAGLLAPSLSASSPLEDEAHRALQDPLTGLPNRMILMDRLQQAIYDARRYDRPFGVFVIEPDGIDGVSNALGRDATDAVMRAISTGLNSTVRSGDTLARIDADHFVILCINAERSVAEERIKSRVETVLGSVTKEIGLDGVELLGHLGVVWSSDDEANAEGLLTSASTAASRTKRNHHTGP